MPPNKPLIRCSAPGKVILHGEHSVVYGKLAIAASLDLRTTVTMEERANSKLEINFIDLKFKRHFTLADISSIQLPQTGGYLDPESIDHNQLIEQIKGLNIPADLSADKYNSLIALLYLYYGIVSTAQLPLNALYLTVKTDLTLGSGTGSSASLMVALSSAFIHYIITKKPELKPEFEVNPDNYECFNEFQLKLISRWGFQAERIIHGNPSGIDNTVCTYGSLVSFRKGRAPFPVKCVREIRGVIVDTNVPKNTAIQVEKVANLLKKRPKIVENILEALENVSDEALDCLIQLGDADDGLEGLYRDLLGLAEINHHLLQSLGVSHPSLDKTVEIMSKFGLKGKLTGAGGGGYAIALIPPFVCVQDVQELCAHLEAEGFKGTLIKLGSSGVRFEK